MTNIMRLPFGVTITGADDHVDPQRLIGLSRKYPLVEWALLFSLEKEGCVRFPSAGWRKRFHGLCANQPFKVRKALHLCGDKVFHRMLEMRTLSLPAELDEEFRAYERIQLNINALSFSRESLQRLFALMTCWGACREVGIILQLYADSRDAIQECIDCLNISFAAGKIAVLLDSSRGNGAKPECWATPVVARSSVFGYCGYAGGLGPENIEAEYDAIVRTVARSDAPLTRFWLDMESGVRTADQLDLEKVEHVLSCVEHQNMLRQPPRLDRMEMRLAGAFLARSETDDSKRQWQWPSEWSPSKREEFARQFFAWMDTGHQPDTPEMSESQVREFLAYKLSCAME